MPKSVAIVGAGLAGAACANAFANAGFKVDVFEQGAAPAAGASGVPLAMFAPSVSADDAPHSRLLRRGVHVLLEELRRLAGQGLLEQGVDWALTGAVERCIRGPKKLPRTWLEPQDLPELQSKMLASASDGDAGLECDVQSLLHGTAGWVRPDRLIAAWLSHPAITLSTNVHIASLDDTRLQTCDVIVLSLGYQTVELLPSLRLQLQPIRGQVEWGDLPNDSNISIRSTCPINGMGHWVQNANRWLTGATFQRDELDLAPSLKDVVLNFEKLAKLRPELGKPLLDYLAKVSQSWVGIRVAQKNRAPFIERISGVSHSNTWICTGLGSRGLSLAAQNAQTLLQKILGYSR